jgi:hypothetical protein
MLVPVAPVTLTQLFKGGDLVFCKPQPGSAQNVQWQAAFIIPSEEILQSMCAETIPENERLVRLFEDYTYAIKNISDLALFSPASPHYTSFTSRTANLAFNSLTIEDKGVSRAITFSNRFLYVF